MRITFSPYATSPRAGGWLGTAAGLRVQRQRGARVAPQANVARRDGAALAVQSRLRSRAASVQQGIRNARDAISMLEDAADGLDRIGERLTGMLDLAERVASGTYSADLQEAMQAKVDALIASIDAIASAVVHNTHQPLTTAADYVVSLGSGRSDSTDTIRIWTQGVTSQQLGLTSPGTSPTTATLTASATYGAQGPTSVYLKGPNKNPAVLTFTFDGSQGEKVIALELTKNNAMNVVVALINTQSEALVSGWTAAEAIEVEGDWLLRVSTYEAGGNQAPTVAVEGDLTWKDGTPVEAGHFTGEDGVSGSEGGPFLVSAADAIQKIEDAVAAVAGLGDRIRAWSRQLETTTLASRHLAGTLSAAETRLADIASAAQAAAETREYVLQFGTMALLLQGDASAEQVLQLLGMPFTASLFETAPSLSLLV